MNAMKFVWPERIVVLTAVVVAIIMFLFWVFLAAGAQSLLAGRLDRIVFHWSIEAEAMLVLPLWLLLRVIYFVKSYWMEWRTNRSRSQTKLSIDERRMSNKRRLRW
jgi:hypothetical protein